MSYKKEILTAVGTLACAIGIGFIMQSGQDAHDRYGTTDDTPELQMKNPVSQSAILGTPADDALLEFQDITLTSVEVDKMNPLPTNDLPVITTAAPHSSLDTPEIPELGLGDDCSTLSAK